MNKEDYFAPDIDLYEVSVERGFQTSIGGGEYDSNQEDIGDTLPDGEW